jgi:arsenical pump membrane protein
MHAPFLVLLIIGLSILLMLVRPRGVPEVYWIGAGALLLIAFRLVPLRLALAAAAEGTDVYLFLIGMMLLVARVPACSPWSTASGRW